MSNSCMWKLVQILAGNVILIIFSLSWIEPMLSYVSLILYGNPTKWSNTQAICLHHKQFIGNNQQIVWVWLTILGLMLKGLKSQDPLLCYFWILFIPVIKWVPGPPWEEVVNSPQSGSVAPVIKRVPWPPGD